MTHPTTGTKVTRPESVHYQSQHVIGVRFDSTESAIESDSKKPVKQGNIGPIISCIQIGHLIIKRF